MAAAHGWETWVAFHLLVFALLALDLGVFNRKQHVIHMKEAAGWSLVWIAIGLSFSAWIAHQSGRQAAVEYVTGYIVEKSLSVDNLFVFLIIFEALRIPRKNQHRLLFWGIFGAIVLRGAMILAGAHLIERFHWVIYVFGAFLVFTGLKLLKGDTHGFDPKQSPVFRAAHRFLPLTMTDSHDGRFTMKVAGRRKFTVAFVALLLIETSDVIFALDSVPAVFGVTRDPYIVYTSNVFAILGLRALFFVLEDLLYRFHLLKVGLAVVLMFVGCKMLLEAWLHIAPLVSLGVIGSVLLTSVLVSLAIPPPAAKRLPLHAETEPEERDGEVR